MKFQRYQKFKELILLIASYILASKFIEDLIAEEAMLALWTKACLTFIVFVMMKAIELNAIKLYEKGFKDVD